jgi:PAS domain S-box-containing protein
LKEKAKAAEEFQTDTEQEQAIPESSEPDIKGISAGYKLFFEHSSDCLLILAPDGQILEANPAACATFGMTVQEICLSSWASIVDPAELSFGPFMSEAMQSGKAQKIATCICKDGSRFRADIIAVAYKDEHGLDRTSIIICNRTSQQFTADASPESEALYSKFFFLSPQPMWVFEADTFKFIAVNKAAMEQYGYSRDEFMNMTILDIKPREDAIQARANIKKRTAGYGVSLDTFKHIKKSGETIEVEIYSNPIVIDGKVYLLVIATDVTGKNQQEHRIVKAIIQAQEEERYEISKELHEDVCQILAASQLSLGRLKEIQAPTGSLLIAESKENIANATRAIRKLSQRLAPAFHDFTTLKQEFVTLVKSFDQEAGCRIDMHVDDAVMNYNLSLDLKLTLYRILQEQLKTTLQHANCTTIDVSVLIQDEKIRMIISDDGDGIEPGAGYDGIGLSGIRRRASLFAGKLEIKSSPGNGCTVSIDIPLPALA